MSTVVVHRPSNGPRVVQYACLGVAAFAALAIWPAVFLVPLVTVDSGTAGMQPRLSAFRYFGPACLWVPVVCAALVLVCAAMLLRFPGRKSVGGAALAVSGTAATIGLIGFAVAIWPIVVLPPALLCAAASVIALTEPARAR